MINFLMLLCQFHQLLLQGIFIIDFLVISIFLILAELLESTHLTLEIHYFKITLCKLLFISSNCIVQRLQLQLEAFPLEPDMLPNVGLNLLTHFEHFGRLEVIEQLDL